MIKSRFSEFAEADAPIWRIIFIGVIALAMALGIGRFAFTPLLPLMLRDGNISASVGAQWATANYAGYLIGALIASRFSGNPVFGLRLGLMGVAVTTLPFGWIQGSYMPLEGAVLRTAAGAFSAWVLVCASSWCLVELARRGSTHLGAWVYTGVGLGIALTGLFAWLGGGQAAKALWLELGLLSSAGALFVWLGLPSARTNSRSTASESSSPPTSTEPRHLALVLCYGTSGFGYIVPATFLPAMAWQRVSDPLLFGLTWPLFGLAAALSVAAAARWLAAWPRRHVWALAQGTMAMGTALPLVTQALWSLAISAILVGGTFMVATMAGLQLAREQSPNNPTPLLSRMTVAFATGQIAGPLLILALGPAGAAWGDALFWANAQASALLAATAAWLWSGASPSTSTWRPSR